MPSQREYLQYLCNKYGDYKVAKAEIDKDDNKVWKSWKSVLECWESDYWINYLDLVNNRQILPVEVIFDIDDKEEADRIVKLKRIEKLLEYWNINHIIYFTGSKGFHIHCIIKEMIFLSKNERFELRKFWFDKIHKSIRTDVLKHSENTMIALENAPHWKTGNLKKEIKRWPDDFHY